jgi:hypothetical protein
MAFCEGLAQNTVMTHLHLKDVPEEQITYLRQIATAIESNQALTWLEINQRGSSLPLDFCQALSLALTQNSTVEQISVTVPEDDLAGVVEIVKAAQTNKKLRKTVCHSGISHNHQIIALNALAGNTNLEMSWLEKLGGAIMNEEDAAMLLQAVSNTYGMYTLKV